MSSEHRFIRACRGEPTDCTPVWFMRQAGRYMAEYREIRAERSFLEVSKTPSLCAEVTLQPIRAFDLDAAIIFADIMTPLEGIGLEYDIVKGVGPVIDTPVASDEAVAALTPFDVGAVDFLLEGIERVVDELAGEVPLIGFAGAPFTLACYIVQGQSSRNFIEARTFMHAQPELWARLMSRLADMVTTYLQAQVRAGAAAVQVFDSWVGLLSPRDYQRHVMPYMRRIFDGLSELDVPRIHFGTGTAALLELMADAGGDVIGLDWRVPIAESWARIGYDRAVQGNLDPTVLLTDEATIDAHIEAVLEDAGGRPGHIFNVGHGINRNTKPEHVDFAVRRVHERSRS